MLKHWHARAKLNLNKEEIKQIITRTCPVSWKTKLQLSGKLTYQHSIESLTMFLNAVQRNMADAAKLKQNSQKEKKPNRSTNKINKNVNDWGSKKSKKFCAHCKRNDAPDRVYQNHDSHKCEDMEGK